MPKTQSPLIYQFKITLLEISPPIWRRIQVPENYTFWDLHVAIQDAMGWTDSHLHAFRMPTPTASEIAEIGIPLEDTFDDRVILAGWEENIKDWFSIKNNSALYNYDFGDDWDHDIILESIIPKDDTVKYPVCLAGERACPPEDCGGIGGYEHILELMDNPDDEEYEEMIEWLGGKFDPNAFKLSNVKFDNPKKRLKNLLEN